MKIPLKLNAEVNYYKPEDREKTIFLAHRIEMKMTEKKFYEPINKLLCEAAKECLDDMELTVRIEEPQSL